MVQQVHRKAQGRWSFQMAEIDGEGPFINRSKDELIIVLIRSASPSTYWCWPGNALGKYERLTPGSFLLVPPGPETGWQIEGHLEALTLGLQLDTVRGMMGAACPQNLAQIFACVGQNKITDPFLEILFKQLWDALPQLDQAYGSLRNGIVTAILSQLLLKSTTDAPEATTVIMPQWRLRKVEQFVEANLGESVSLQDMASAAGVSKRHFARSFQQEVGETPIRWLMQRRVDRAKKMLEETDIPLCEIALICGFASQSHLTRVLKQSAGSTPLRWRQMFRNLHVCVPELARLNVAMKMQALQ
jgi:AraC family transcriptional regulator